MDHMDRANLICQEFTKHIWVDEDNESVLVLVEKKWYINLLKRLRQNDFIIALKVPTKKNIYCTFVWDPLNIDFSEIYDDSDDDEKIS